MVGLGMRRATRLASRRAVRLVALALLASSLVTAHIIRSHAQSAEEAVTAADRALGEAIRTADRSLARRLLALQFTYTDEAGRAYSRHDFLADLKDLAALPAADPKPTDPRLKDAKLTDPKLTMYGLLATV